MEKPQLPLHRLWAFPFIAGTSWMVTLLTLLIAWFANGQPEYPRQSNPYVPYISDIGAFTLKLVFLIGGCLTAIFFTATICSVHYARYSYKMYALQDARYTRIVSWAAIAGSVLAGVSLISLCILDTYHWHVTHRYLLMVCFCGIGVAATCTSFVYFDQTRKASPFTRLRPYCVMNTFLVLCELGLGIAFVTLLYMKWWRTAGFLEWTITFLGALWLLSFIGYVAVPEEGIDLRERSALLDNEA